jgi:phytanoyl-CoA hydroxylase
MKPAPLTDNDVTAFNRDGYLIVRNFIETAAIDKLYTIALEDASMKNHAFDLNDQAGKKTKLALWYTPGDDAYGLLTKSVKMVRAANQLMEGDSAVCHFHSKLMQKEPRVGGAWEWHQDYGYWYKNEFLFPGQMLSIMIAITEATSENGCLQVIKGSQKMGRVEHGFTGEQVGASARYVELALKTLELVYVELQPGDALLFHPNLLHRSAANNSDNSRWSMISVYNRASNIPYNEPSQSSTVPLKTVPDDALLKWDTGGLSDNASFLEKEKDQALK